MAKIGRNDPCSCGSGKKYKNCHQQMDNEKQNGKRNLIIAGVIALLMIFAAIGFYFNNQSPGNTAPGEAPKGKVWSEEHGHWHDI